MLGTRELNIVGNLPNANCSSGPYEFTAGTLDNPCDLFHFWSLHAGGANFLMADGSVHFLSYSAGNACLPGLDVSILEAMGSRAGGELFDSPF